MLRLASSIIARCRSGRLRQNSPAPSSVVKAAISANITSRNSLYAMPQNWNTGVSRTGGVKVSPHGGAAGARRDTMNDSGCQGRTANRMTRISERQAPRCFAGGVGIPTSVSTAGWHVAHIYNAKDRNTDWRNWTRAELTRRLIRNVHPCNCFYIPKPEWQRYGGHPEVIAFFASEYSTRYGSVWEEFRQLAVGEPLPGVDGESVHYA